MLTGWRIIRPRYAASAFDGEGARLAGGRWNSPGVAVAYLAASRALAALELLVHLPAARVLDEYVCRGVEFDDALARRLESGELPANWRAEPEGLAATRAFGDAWVRSRETVVLQVPSFVVPEEANFLLNPAHPDFAKLALGPAEPFGFDPRLAAGR